MRTAVVMPVGARFCREQPNSMETVARTLARAETAEVRVFCCEGADDHDTPLARYGGRVQILRSAPLADVRAVMQKAAIALTPSVWAEPLGLTALEAHAAGAALISSGRGGLREASGPHAVYVDDLTAPGLGAAIETLINDPARREAMARSAQAYVLETHTPERRAAQLAALRAKLVLTKRAGLKLRR
ncbi:D-inositol-3-phosphate glycosyltransferase [compost metagenome]